jgi:26S proteasome regulatory subunit N5
LFQADLSGAIDSLVLLEKQSRLGADMRSNSRLLRHMVKLAFDAKNWNTLNEIIVTMSKKRSLIKYAIKNMIEDCCEMIDKIPSEDERNRLIDTLRTVTAGKIYVEVERARLTKRVVEKLEKEGKYDEAWNNLIELQVETFGSMEIKEKARSFEAFPANSHCLGSILARSNAPVNSPQGFRSRLHHFQQDQHQVLRGHG